MNNKVITIGSDPEIFVQNSEGNVASAIGMVKGSKNNPHPIDDKGHFVQTDNIAFEYNIPPCKSEEEFTGSIHFVKDYLETIANANGHSLSPLASSEVEAKYLEHPQAKEFGCEPDLNVYTQAPNESPNNNLTIRSCGGHIAIGYPEPNQETSELLVKAFDIFVALPSLLIDNDDRRRELYGNAGAFRFTDFGVECRVLSNFWIQSEELTRWAYRQTMKAVDSVFNYEIERLVGLYSQKVEQAINTNDKKLAKQLISEIFKEETVLIKK